MDSGELRIEMHGMKVWRNVNLVLSVVVLIVLAAVLIAIMVR
jgi:hypothetical protein